MDTICTFRNNEKQLKVKTERIKTLKVVGEAVGQLVVENQMPICAVKIDRISARLENVTDHLFKGKVVKQGTIIKEIFFVDHDGALRFMTEEVPFMLVVDIPGFEPGPFTEVQNHLLDINVDFSLTRSHCSHRGSLKQIIVAHFLIIASEWTQLDVVTGVESFPKTSFAVKSQCCFK